MYITLDTLILVGSAVGVIATLIGVILKVHKWYLKQEALEKEIAELKQRHAEDIAVLKKHHEDDLNRVNEENTMICYALSACLNGLQQLGANGDVTIAKDKLDKFLNQKAHH